MNLLSEKPVMTTCLPDNETLFTQMTFNPWPPVIVLTALPSMVGMVWVQACALALAAARFAALICALRSALLMTPPMLPELLSEKVAPTPSRIVPVTYSDPVIESLPPGAMPISPMIPPGGPVIETLPVPSSSTLVPAAAPSPSAVSTQFVQGGVPWQGDVDWQLPGVRLML